MALFALNTAIVWTIFLTSNALTFPLRNLELSVGSSGGNNCSSISSRTARNLVQLVFPIHTFTPFRATNFIWYGHWCGFGGNRKGDGSALDPCDECCKKHDICFDSIRDLGCHPVLYGYLVLYDIHQIERVCRDVEGSCSRKVCDCDVAFVDCLRTWSYDECFVGGRTSKRARAYRHWF